MFDTVIELARRVESRAGEAKASAKMLAITLFSMMGLSGRWYSALDSPFAMDNRAQSGADQAVNLVVALVVGGLMAAFLLPIAIDEIATVDTSSWTSGASAMWEILPVMIVLAIFLFFVGVALRRSGRI